MAPKMHMGTHARAALAGTLLFGTVCIGVVSVPEGPVWAASAEGGIASPWVKAHSSGVRLIAGRATAEDGGGTVAGIEISLEPGWKTYWRNPGEAGGVPPGFAFKGSQNLKGAAVRYPAPMRMVEPYGVNIGYKSPGVVFPIQIEPMNRSEGVKLLANVTFGICREVCIPVEAKLELELPAQIEAALPEQLADALAKAPRPETQRRENDPKMLSFAATLEGDQPRLEIVATFPGDSESADVFLETKDGTFVPMTKRVRTREDGAIVFIADLKDTDPADLKSKKVRITLVSDAGSYFAERLVN